MVPSRQAGVARRSKVDECPIEDDEVGAQLRACVGASQALSRQTLRWLSDMTPEDQATWLKRVVEEGRVLFQPWNMEILFALGAHRRARFTELQSLLGVSSRTLSDKLQALREAGFVEREVFDEQPVRIEYALTKHGRRIAALATPLFGALSPRGREIVLG